MDFEVEGVRPRGRSKKSWSEVIEKDCQTQQNMQGRCYGLQRWAKFLKDVV